MATEDNNKITVQQLQPNESSQPRSVPEPNSLPKQALPLNFLYESRVFLWIKKMVGEESYIFS